MSIAEWWTIEELLYQKNLYDLSYGISDIGYIVLEDFTITLKFMLS